MSSKTFKGGIHPPQRKAATVGTLIHAVAEPAQVVIPVNQHFGAPNKAVVQVGDTVKKGQLIADGEGPMNVPVHASIAGVVKKIEPRLQSNNQTGLCIVIEGNKSGETDYLSILDPFSCAKEEALARVRAAGLVGMGGAGFPVHIKLAPPPTKPIDVVIANGAECEPYLTIDESTMIEQAEKVVDGLAIAMHILGVSKGVIGLEDNKPRAKHALEDGIRAAGRGMNITVQLLKTKYPQGGEKMLIDAITGKEVPSGGLPMDVGCVVSNVGTLKALSEAFREGKPLIERGFTVTGAACTKPNDLYAPIGSVIEDLIPGTIDVAPDTLRKILFGGPMMGTSVPHAAVPVQKNTSGVVLMTAEEAGADVEGPCIRCGRCMRACACRLSPVLLNNELEAGDLDAAAKIGLMDCIECGSCSFVCPARIELVQRFRVGKQRLRAKMMAAKAAK